MKNYVFALTLALCLMALSLACPAEGAGGEENAKDLLAAVLLGCETAASSVRTSSGQVTVHEWNWRSNGQLVETEAIYRVASVGDEATYRVAPVGAKFKAVKELRFLNNEWPLPSEPGLRPVESGRVIVHHLAYDGEKITSYRPARRRAVIAGTDSSAGRDFRQVKLEVMSPGHGVPSLSTVSGMPNYTRTGPYVAGREIVNGDECIVLKSVEVGAGADGAEVKFYGRSWINPQKGFTLCKGESSAQGGVFGEGTLLAEAEIEVRQYGDALWGISSVQAEQYAVDSSGRRYLQSRTVATFAPDYRLNGPVTEDMLTVKLPSGTTVYNELLDEEYTVP